MFWLHLKLGPVVRHPNAKLVGIPSQVIFRTDLIQILTQFNMYVVPPKKKKQKQKNKNKKTKTMKNIKKKEFIFGLIRTIIVRIHTLVIVNIKMQ